MKKCFVLAVIWGLVGGVVHGAGPASSVEAREKEKKKEWVNLSRKVTVRGRELTRDEWIKVMFDVTYGQIRELNDDEWMKIKNRLFKHKLIKGKQISYKTEEGYFDIKTEVDPLDKGFKRFKKQYAKVVKQK